MKHVMIITLGCEKNTVDAELIAGALNLSGWNNVTDFETADVVLVNTCGFIEAAKTESLEMIFSLIRQRSKPSIPRIVAVGCLAERYAQQLLQEIPEIDGIIGPGYNDQLPTLLESILNGNRVNLTGKAPYLPADTSMRIVSTPETYAYVKISDGCSNRCAYCAIPLIRNALRSRPPESICEEIRLLVAKGYKEIILIAQDTTAFGTDSGTSHGIENLITRIDSLPGDFYVRLMYAHPAHVSTDLIDLFKTSKKLLPYLDIPIQHAHPDILSRMNRHYTDLQLIDIISRLRKARPDIVIRSTILVGFPGEQEKHYNHLMQFLETNRIDHLGVFTYSPEEDTAAFTFSDQVPKKVARQRYQRMMAAHQKRSKAWLRQFVGQTLPVFIDGVSSESEHLLEGRTFWQAPDIDGVVYINKGEATPGSIAHVLITKSYEYDLLGEIVSAL